jgi:hypothetical protein
VKLKQRAASSSVRLYLVDRVDAAEPRATLKNRFNEIRRLPVKPAAAIHRGRRRAQNRSRERFGRCRSASPAV